MSYADQKTLNDKINFVVNHFIKSQQQDKLRQICSFLTTPDILHLMLANTSFRRLLSIKEDSAIPYFIVFQEQYEDGIYDPKFQSIVRDRYLSDRMTFESLTGLKFATNNDKDDDDNESDSENENENESDNENDENDDDDDGKDDNKEENKDSDNDENNENEKNENNKKGHKKGYSIVDELLGKPQMDDQLKFIVFKDELGTLDFQMIKWMLLNEYERTFWGYVLKYQKLLIEQYMLIEERVVSEEHTQPFVSCLANLHDLDFSQIEKTNENYKIYEKLTISKNTINRDISKISDSDNEKEIEKEKEKEKENEKGKKENTKLMTVDSNQLTKPTKNEQGQSPSVTPTPQPADIPSMNADDNTNNNNDNNNNNGITFGKKTIAFSNFYTHNFKSIGMSWLTNILKSNYNLISVLDLSGCGLTDDHILTFCHSWKYLKNTSYLQILSFGSNLGITDLSMKKLFDCIKIYHSQLYYLMLYDTSITDDTCTIIYDFFKFHFGESMTDEQLSCDQRWQRVVDIDYNELEIEEYFDKLLEYKIIAEYDFEEAKKNYYSMKIGELRKKKVEKIGLRGNTQLSQIRLNWCKNITRKGISKLDRIFKEGLLPGVLSDTGVRHTTAQRRASQLMFDINNTSGNNGGGNGVGVGHVATRSISTGSGGAGGNNNSLNMNVTARLSGLVGGSGGGGNDSINKNSKRTSGLGGGRRSILVNNAAGGSILKTVEFDPTNLQYFDSQEKEDVKFNVQQMAILVDSLDMFDKRGDKYQRNLEFELSLKKRKQADTQKKIKKLKRKATRLEQKKVQFTDEAETGQSPVSPLSASAEVAFDLGSPVGSRKSQSQPQNEKDRIEKQIALLETQLANLGKDIMNFESKLYQTKRLPSWDKRIHTDPNPSSIWDHDALEQRFNLEAFV